MKNIKDYTNFVNESEANNFSGISFLGNDLAYWEGYATKENGEVGQDFDDIDCKSQKDLEVYAAKYKERFLEEGAEIGDVVIKEAIALGLVLIYLKGKCNSGIIGAYFTQAA